MEIVAASRCLTALSVWVLIVKHPSSLSGRGFVLREASTSLSPTRNAIAELRIGVLCFDGQSFASGVDSAPMENKRS